MSAVLQITHIIGSPASCVLHITSSVDRVGHFISIFGHPRFHGLNYDLGNVDVYQIDIWKCKMRDTFLTAETDLAAVGCVMSSMRYSNAECGRLACMGGV
jgi:hypothetical protein